MSFIEGLHNKAIDINDALDRFFVSSEHHFEMVLMDSMRYSLCSGGKRIRPVLMLETGKLFGHEDKSLLNFACALEMIHTYSLIHDDLPAMDDDDLRRGKPTNHKIYGEAMAILAGDGLLNYAFELMSSTALQANDMKYVRAMHYVATCSGYQGMIGGQVADIMSEDEAGNAETLNYIHSNKTGRLLTAPLVVAGILASCDETMVSMLERLGQIIGLMFQIKDDLLDIESTEAELGKPIGSDSKNKKLTYPALYGMEASYEKMSALKHEALEIIDQLPGDTGFYVSLVDFLMNRTK